MKKSDCFFLFVLHLKWWNFPFNFFSCPMKSKGQCQSTGNRISSCVNRNFPCPPPLRVHPHPWKRVSTTNKRFNFNYDCGNSSDAVQCFTLFEKLANAPNACVESTTFRTIWKEPTPSFTFLRLSPPFVTRQKKKQPISTNCLPQPQLVCGTFVEEQSNRNPSVPDHVPWKPEKMKKIGLERWENTNWELRSEIFRKMLFVSENLAAPSPRISSKRHARKTVKDEKRD
jgi:hypothetical protein